MVASPAEMERSATDLSAGSPAAALGGVTGGFKQGHCHMPPHGALLELYELNAL